MKELLKHLCAMEALIMVIMAVIFTVFSGCRVTHSIHHEGKAPQENTVREVPAPPASEQLTELEDD
jgi:hypothetical protein